MNSIDKRLEKLKNKDQGIVTRKGMRLERAKFEMLIKQNKRCAGCGSSFDKYDNKPKFDFLTKKFDNPVGLVCAKCDVIISNCSRDTNVLSRIINYLSGGVIDKQEFDPSNDQPTNVQLNPKDPPINPFGWDMIKPK